MALRRHTVPGAWVCDTRPASSGRGPWCAAVWRAPSLETHWGRLTVRYPRGSVQQTDTALYPVLNDDVTRIAAINGRTDEVLRWDGSGWTSGPDQALGPCGVIFERDGSLRISRGEAGVGATGYRYVDERGRVVSCSATYQHAASSLFEFTVLPGGYVIGQGPDNNDAFLFDAKDGTYRSLIPGFARYVRAYRRGDDIAVCAWVTIGDAPHAEFVWGTLAEVLALPALKTPKKPWRDDPPATVPTFRTPDHAIRVQVFGGPGFRMNLGPGHDRDANAKPSGAFVTLDSVTDLLRFDEQAEYAKKNNVPFFQYLDRKESRWTKDTLRQIPGVRCVAAVRCYPLGPGYLKIALDDIEVLRRAGIETALVLAGYRQMIGHGPAMNWRLQDVLAFAADAWDTSRTIETVRHALIFHQHRESPKTGHVDGLDSRPELQLMADRIASAASAYTPPKPPPVKKPDPPHEKPPIPPDPPMGEPPTGYVELGDVLERGERWYSADGQSWLQLDATDGHLVRYYRDPGGQITARWDAGIGGAIVDRVQLNPDGNLVAYTAYNQPLWASNTSNRGIVRMRVDASRLAFLGRNDAVVAQIPRVEEKESKQDMNAVAKVFAALLGFGWLWGRR